MLSWGQTSGSPGWGPAAVSQCGCSVPARGPQGPPVAPGLKDAKLNQSQIFTGAASDLVGVRGGSEQVKQSSLTGVIVWELLDSVSDGRDLETVLIFDRVERHRISGF